MILMFAAPSYTSVKAVHVNLGINM